MLQTKNPVPGSISGDRKGEPQKNLLLYFYQTSGKGWYADTGIHILVNSGDYKHARLFGYVKTGEQGDFSFETIKPNGYPRSDLAAHIHIQVWTENMEPVHAPGELQFDDDPRMTTERRNRSMLEGYLVSKNSGTKESPVYEYKLLID